MSKQLGYDAPIVKIESIDRESPETPGSTQSAPAAPTTSGNVFTSFIKKVPNYSQISPALKRKTNGKKGESVDPTDPAKRSAVSQIFHSVPDAVKKKFSRGDRAAMHSPDSYRWESDDEEIAQRPGHFRRVLEQIKTADTPLLVRSEEIDKLEIEHPDHIMSLEHGTVADHVTVESDDENTDHDGLFSSIFNQLTTVPSIEAEVRKCMSEIEVTQRNNTELTKKYLETSKAGQEGQTREEYNQRNLKSQKHIRGLQKKLKNLEERKQRIIEQEQAVNSGTGQYEYHDPVERQKTPDHVKKTGVIQGVVKKAVAKRRRTRPLNEKNWGSDSAIDSSGVLELAETIIPEGINPSSQTSSKDTSAADHELSGAQPPANHNLEYSDVLSDEDEHNNANVDELEYISDRADSVSNITDHAQESLNKLQDGYNSLSAEVAELKKSQKDMMVRIEAEFAKFNTYLEKSQQNVNMELGNFMDGVDDKFDKISYSSEERIKDVEERLDKYRFKITQFEQMQEQKRQEGPLTGNDFANRGRDVLSSLISLGLAMVSFILFIVTTVVDCVKIFSENNALSTALSLALFAVVIAAYYYFEADRQLREVEEGT